MDKCPCCGWSEELGQRVAEVEKALADRSAERRKWEDERLKTVPRGDCDSCVNENTTCNYSCVGI